AARQAYSATAISPGRTSRGSSERSVRPAAVQAAQATVPEHRLSARFAACELGPRSDSLTAAKPQITTTRSTFDSAFRFGCDKGSFLVAPWCSAARIRGSGFGICYLGFVPVDRNNTIDGRKQFSVKGGGPCLKPS